VGRSGGGEAQQGNRAQTDGFLSDLRLRDREE
jgi:hypothetical protein